MSPTNKYGRPGEEMFLNNPPAGRREEDESPIVEPLRIYKPPSTSTPTPQSATSTALPYPDDRPRPSKSQSPSSQTPYPEPNSRIASPAQSASSGDYPAALRPRDGRDPKPSLAERRGNAPPKPLPESPGPDTPDKDELFQKFPPPGPPRPAAAEASNNNAQSNQPFFPPPTAASAAQARLKASNPASINRISSTASNSTTRAQRGSPPPPETPIVGPGQRPGADIEARFAAAGIAGTSTLAGLQARNAAAQQRANQYAGQAEVQRPWTPTEQPGTQPHGPPTVYQGDSEIGTQQYPPPASTQPVPQQAPPPNNVDRQAIPPNALEQDLQRMNLSSSPPPAYSTVPGATSSQSYPNEKGRPAAASPPPPQGHPASSIAPSVAGSSVSAVAGIPPVNSPAPSVQSHPAFANDPRQQSQQQIPQTQTPVQQQQQQVLSPQQGYPASVINDQSAQPIASPATSQFPPASPPPLPEGWIAHLDPNSGQYYYIHLPTQSTQWEFPKGPTPLNLNETPMSPVNSVYSAHPLTSPAFSTFGGKPLASPGVPMTPMYEGSVMGLSTVGTAITGPPPSSGVELYKVAPTNGVYFGPYLRYCNMDIERGIWLGSILLVTDAPQPPTIHIHQSVDLSPNPRQLKAVNISQHQRWVFYKYDVDLQMDESGPAKWTYAITSHLGCTRYEFLVAGRYETNWRFIATSGNDFSINVNANERARLGGVGFMWKDIMQKYAEVGGFHCQLGLGGQISADRIWKEIPLLKQWLGIHGKDQRKNTPWTAAHEEEVSHAYFHFYTSHFDQPYLREAFAQIPHILQLDDHDM
jgi:PhoD related phosphatase/WW domain